MEDTPLWEPCLRPEYPPLRGTERADVAIVGGGLTGVTCAAMLSALGVQVALLEADVLGRGASWNCTGKVTSQLAGVYTTVAQKAGMQAARTYAGLMQDAVRGIGQMCLRLNVPTQRQNVYVFAETTDDLPALHQLHQLEDKLGLSVRIAPDAGGCPFPVELSLVMEDQLLVQPIPYLLALARQAEEQGCIIHEHTAVRAIEGRQVLTEHGCLEAETVLLATASPLGCTSLKRLTMMQQRTCQILVLESSTPLMNSHLSVQPDELTLRPTPTGAVMAWDMGRTGGKERAARQLILERTLRGLLPEWQVKAAYIRQDAWSGDGLPIIGPVKPQEGRVLMAAGYSGWGLCNSFLAARLLTAHMTGRPMAEAALFRPDRSAPHLGEGLRTAGAYLDGLLHPGAPTCTHMAGKLRYDPESGRWECPCHGSTFTTLGLPIDAPACAPAAVSAKQR